MDGDLAPTCFVLLIVMTAVQPQISKGPTNSLKGTGDTITLHCFTNNNNCFLLDWQKVEGRQSPKIVYRNGVGMIKNELFPTERYNVTEGLGCNLTIKQLQVSDSGRYVCVLTMSGGTEDTKSSVLVVVDATENCVLNSTNTNLTKDDVYTVSCAIKMPPKTLEPTDVMLKMDNQMGTVDTADPNMDIRATLAAKVTQSELKHVCNASFEPLSKEGYDNTPASLEVCNFTQSLNIKFFPVESTTIEASADGDDPTGGGSNVAIIVCVIVFVVVLGCVVVVYICWKNEQCLLYGSLRSIKCRKDEKSRESGVPLTSSAKPINDGPEKPPRSINDHQ